MEKGDKIGEMFTDIIGDTETVKPDKKRKADKIAEVSEPDKKRKADKITEVSAVKKEELNSGGVDDWLSESKSKSKKKKSKTKSYLDDL